ncbi:MAG: Hsp20/alpha crystallin family protein [Proteobacteria bacterium]|nr:Hsp20/alpha crystallin family protein [Pseudomonadota bacterium]MBU1611253.1 Hsp20/alpha crystallin family protein [Pseudomonadota bacterium]
MVLDFDTVYAFPSRMDRLFEEFIRPGFGSRKHFAYPPLNVSEDADTIFVRAEVPGVGLDDLEITLTDKSLVLKGERKAEEGRYFRQERPAGAFQRVVRLNVPVAREKTKASLVDGILTISLPRAEEARPKKISIDVG